MTDEAKAIIAAFDRCLAFIYGHRYARDNPHKTDAATAQHWVDDGLDPILATLVFGQYMAMMHERFLRNTDPNDRRNIPAVLSLFDDNILSALRRDGIGGQVDMWEQAQSQWRARLTAFFAKGYWLPDNWGPAPNERGCRAPMSVIEEFKKKKR